MLIARNAIRPDHAIEDAVIIQAHWGDDTPSYYAVGRDDFEAQKAVFELHGCKVLEADAPFDHLWIGIKVAAIGGVAAWGRANIEGA